MTISPLSQIERISGRIFRSFSLSSIRKNCPDDRTTHGPSESALGVTAHAFPGRSIFICVPMVMKSSRTNIEAGLSDAAASPDGRPRP